MALLIFVWTMARWHVRGWSQAVVVPWLEGTSFVCLALVSLHSGKLTWKLENPPCIAALLLKL